MYWAIGAVVVVVLLLAWILYPVKQQLVISCTEDRKDKPPTGFEWARTLAIEFPGKYDITIVLHGELIKLGLTNNPHQALETDLMRMGVKFVICNLCLQDQIDGIRRDARYANATLLDFVVPVKFSIDYIADRAKNNLLHQGATIIYC